MNTSNLKKLLLTGTAIIAVGAFAASANAADLTLTGPATWGTVANGMVDAVAAGDNVILGANTLTIDASDAERTVGAITSATTGAVTITTATDADVTTTIGSIAITGAGNITQNVTDQTTRSIATTVTGDVSTGGNLALTIVEPDAASTNTLSVGGALTVGGTSALTGGNFGGASTTALTVTGNSTFTGGMTVTGGANALATATLNLNGATNTGDIALVNTRSVLNLAGTTAQTVGGVLSGLGVINVNNTTAGGVTFTGANTHSGALNVNAAAANQSVTFTGNVDSNITLGDNTDTDTKTATFGGAADTTVSGDLVGGGAADTVALNFVGGNIVTLTGAATTEIDTVAVSGNTTLLSSTGAITATTVTVDAGSTLEQGTGTIAAAIANSGVIKQTGTGAINGAITGTGKLDIDESATYTGAITQSSADVADTKTLTTVGAYSVATTTLSGATAGITFTTGNDVTGNIVAAATGNGVVTFTDVAATSAVVGNIGTAAAAVEDLVITDAANAAVVTTTGNLYVNDIDLGQADSLQFIGTGTQIVSGTIDATNNTGAGIVVGNGTTAKPTVTFNGVIGGSGFIDTLTINDGATVVLNEDATFDDAFSADGGKVKIAAGKTLTVATQTDGDVVTYDIEVNKVGGGAQTNGSVVLTGGAAVLANDVVNFNVKAGSAPLTIGASVLDDVFTSTGAADVTGLTITDNSFLYGFEAVVDTNNVDFTVTEANSINNTATSAGKKNAGNTLQGLTTSTNAQINQIQGSLAAAGTAKAVNDVLEATVSDVSGGAVNAGFSVARQTGIIANQRTAALRSGDVTSMSAGDMSDGVKVWSQAFGQTATQDERDGVSGYDADTYGFVVGIDTEALADDMTVGLAFGYANTEVESDAADSAETDVNAYQISLYGDYDLNANTYVSGQLGYIFGDNDVSRTNVGGVSGLNASGDFDSSTIVAGVEVGRGYDMDGGFTLTPKVYANYVNYSADGYTETGTAGGANLVVGDVDVDMLEFGLAVDAAWIHNNADGSSLKPVLSLGVRHDVIGDEVSTTNQFTGGGSAFSVKGFDPAQTTFDVGAAVTYFSTDNWEFSAAYDFEMKSDYDAHGASIKAAYKF